jgi:hypothetical protein
MTIECLYCGRRWEWKPGYYNEKPVCPCGERKQLRRRANHNAKKDVYGYNHKAPSQASEEDQD